MDKTIELKKEQLDRIMFDDEVLPIGDSLENGTPADRLNFLLWAYDDIYIWSGCYKDEAEAEEWRFKGYYNIYFNYDPVSKKVYLDIVGHDEVPNEDVDNIEVIGDGVEPLIEKMEAYCNDQLGESCSQVLVDYNEQFRKDLEESRKQD